jgi:hypothetical protein
MTKARGWQSMWRLFILDHTDIPDAGGYHDCLDLVILQDGAAIDEHNVGIRNGHVENPSNIVTMRKRLTAIARVGVRGFSCSANHQFRLNFGWPAPLHTPQCVSNGPGLVFLRSSSYISNAKQRIGRFGNRGVPWPLLQ